MVEHPSAAEPDPERLARPHPSLDVDATLDAGPDRHASLRDAEPQRAAEMARERGRQRIAAAQIDLAHAAHVADELAVLEELGDGALDERVALHVAKDA